PRHGAGVGVRRLSDGGRGAVQRPRGLTPRMRRPVFLRTLAFSLIPALCLTGGCSRTSPFRAVERSIREQLPQLIGPADGYDVTVSRSSGSLIAGRIPWVAIHGRNVRAIEGLTLDDLEVRLEAVRFSRATRTVQEIGQTRFVAHLSAASIVNFVHRRSPNLRDVQVTISGGAVRVRTSPSLLGIGVPLEVEGHPALRGESA